jgi:hypothetical protein
MQICEYARRGYLGGAGDVRGCEPIARPAQLPTGATPAAITGNLDAHPQSFWNLPDGTIRACAHEAVNKGSLPLPGWTIDFDRIKKCEEFHRPDKGHFPEGMQDPKDLVLVAAKSNDDHSLTFWQGDSGRLAICDNKGNSVIGKGFVGEVKKCQRWWGMRES